MTAPHNPQYARSTDSDVIAAVQRNAAGRSDFEQRAILFGAEHDAGSPKYGNRSGVQAVAWYVKADSKNIWIPPPGTPEYDEFRAIRFRPEPVPGLPTMLIGRPAWKEVSVHEEPVVFVVGGAAYAGVEFEPRGNLYGDYDLARWHPIGGDEYHRAHEQAGFKVATIRNIGGSPA